MGLFSRFQLLLRARASAAMDRAEDPRETLDYAYEQQHELLRKVRLGLVSVATSRRQLDRQTERIRERVPRLEEQATRALAADREDLARLALERRQAALAELRGLEEQAAEVAREEDRLTATEQALAARIEQYRSQRNIISARYTAAEAQVRVNEALTGLSGDLAELGRALGRAEEKTERMQARAAALDAFLDPRALAMPAPGGDDIERELRQADAARAVELELADLKRELARRRCVPLEAGPEAPDGTIRCPGLPKSPSS